MFKSTYYLMYQGTGTAYCTLEYQVMLASIPIKMNQGYLTLRFCIL